MSKELGYATSSISYSCISLTNVAKKLRLDSEIQTGDLELLRHVAKQVSSTFNSKRTHNLIVKL
ncbi:putative 26s proteasome non-atpase regulatory subunit 3 [Quercus suber]|uniref:26s proteasome non-atpase regulatory subunit 3 n=1 Tax=Quercus suber TaxID=58331 RepID=A0AAW0LYG8_QUESU